MKASLTRSLVVASALFAFGFLAIAPSHAQSGGGGGCCGGSSSTPNTNTNAPAPITCGANTVPGTGAQAGTCVNTNP